MEMKSEIEKEIKIEKLKLKLKSNQTEKITAEKPLFSWRDSLDSCRWDCTSFRRPRWSECSTSAQSWPQTLQLLSCLTTAIQPNSRTYGNTAVQPNDRTAIWPNDQMAFYFSSCTCPWFVGHFSCANHVEIQQKLILHVSPLTRVVETWEVTFPGQSKSDIQKIVAPEMQWANFTHDYQCNIVSQGSLDPGNHSTIIS